MTRLSAAVFLLASCGARSRYGYDDNADGDSDSDGDVDVDVDSDMDVDADSDSDTGYAYYDAGPDPGRECIPRAENNPPVFPQLLYPTVDACGRVVNPMLQVANSPPDVDGDTLRYHFDIDRDVGFRSIDLQTTPDEGVPEGPPGFTEWRVPRALVDGETYYWRVWVDDCWEESEKIVSVFEVCAG